MRRLPKWEARAETARDALAHLTSGMRIFVQGAAATPTPLLDALVARKDLERLTLYHLHTSGPCHFADARYSDRIRSVSLFAGPALRVPIEEGRADVIPIFLSDVPALFTSGQVPIDAALLQLSPPDSNGHCTLGTSIDAAKAAADTARVVIAEINEQMPRTHGRTIVAFDRLTAFVHTNRPLFENEPTPETEVDSRIGEIIADLVEDGSTLQLGIGGIPDAVLRRLHGKHDLGIHTEMFSDNAVDLIRSGAVTNRLKKVHAGRTVTSFVTGSRKVYDFVDDNLTVEFHPCDRTNDTAIIRDNPKVVAINSAIEVDLTGQVCADSIGHRIYSGIGGQMDFIHGAALSKGGKPIIALPSTAAGGKVSRIVAALRPGGGVVTTRGHVHWIVTEYGAVNLHGKTLRERAEMLISIAHPDYRAELRRVVAQIRHFTFP